MQKNTEKCKEQFIALRNRVLKIKKIKIQLSFVNFAKSSKKLKKLFSAKSGWKWEKTNKGQYTYTKTPYKRVKTVKK